MAKSFFFLKDVDGQMNRRYRYSGPASPLMLRMWVPLRIQCVYQGISGSEYASVFMLKSFTTALFVRVRRIDIVFSVSDSAEKLRDKVCGAPGGFSEQEVE
ncbi:hypothetical protein GOBAR_DD14239 [Gossypium barbadense]|nr:hypothetical protein GOBAR_DD14239 [Gossypium barbadense]